jgi:asparagine synthase (glutamine-hydrolysing)
LVHLRRGVSRGLRKLAALLPVSSRNMSLNFKINRSLMGLSYRQALWNPVWLGPVEPDMMKHLFREPLSAEELYSEAIELWDADPKLDLLGRTLAFFTNFYLQDDILMKADRAAMMNSLETRAVFLDNDLVDFCQRLPNHLKYRNGERKYLLKKAMRSVLPASVLTRRKKGFGIPLTKWLCEVPPSPPLEPIEGIMIDWVARQWREHRRGMADHRLFLWSWLSLQALLITRTPHANIVSA